MAAVGAVTQHLLFQKFFIFACAFKFAYFQDGQVLPTDDKLSTRHILEMKMMLANLNRKLENLEKNFAMTSGGGDFGSGSCDCGPTSSCPREPIGKVDDNFVNSLLDQVRRTCARSSSQVLNKMADQLQNLESWHSEFKSEYSRSMQKLLFHRDCEDFRRKGNMQSGVYTIYPVKQMNPVRVLCDMEFDNGGWTVIQRRGYGQAKVAMDFHRDWNAYKHGFGNSDEEFWLGNEAVHRMTNRAAKGCTLRIELRNSKDGRLWVAQYARFTLGSESEKYMLRLQSYSGNATDGLHLHNERPFCTWDREEDPVSRGCAWLERSGWWHHPVATPNFRRICSYPLAGTNLNAPSWKADGTSGGAPEVHVQTLTLQATTNGSFRHAFVFMGTLHWMDKDGRHFDQVEMKIRPNF